MGDERLLSETKVDFTSDCVLGHKAPFNFPGARAPAISCMAIMRKFDWNILTTICRFAILHNRYA